MKFNLATAISTGIQAFSKTGNPWTAAGAAAAGGLVGPAAPVPVAGDTIGSVLGRGTTDPLRSLGAQKNTDWGGLL